MSNIYYKVVFFKCSENKVASATQLQNVLNDYADEGWTVKNLFYLSDAQSYHILLERKIG